MTRPYVQQGNAEPVAAYGDDAHPHFIRIVVEVNAAQMRDGYETDVRIACESATRVIRRALECAHA